MAAQILSGQVTPQGNYTLYTNNTGQNVRLIIHLLWIAGAVNDSTYSTRRVLITGGTAGILYLPIANFFWTSPGAVQRLDVRIGKGVAISDTDISQFTGSQDPTNNTTYGGDTGYVRTIVFDGVRSRPAEGAQVFPTEILMRPNQSMIFEASSPSSRQLIAFNITAMPEGG